MIEPDTQANFGKRGGRYAATQTELELEYTPNQFVELEFGPTISYYNMRGVPSVLTTATPEASTGSWPLSDRWSSSAIPRRSP